MTRARLSLAVARAPKRPSLALVKKAIRLYRSKSVPREVWKANAIKWLRSVEFLGARHLLKGGEPKWGVPGEPSVEQVFAPRRLKGNSP